MNKRVIILGAGPTGLGAGWRLKEVGYSNWAVFEQKSYPGGLSASLKDEKGFIWDFGGHIIFSSIDRFNALVEEVLGEERVFHRRESWVRIYDQFIKYPFQNNFHFLKSDVVRECVFGLVDNYCGKPVKDDFRNWIFSVFGKGIAKHFMIPYNEKVWAADLSAMDAEWISQRVSMIDLKKVIDNLINRHEEDDWGPNSSFSYPLKGGTGELFTRMASRFDEKINYDCEVTGIDYKRHEIEFSDGRTEKYDLLVTTVPLPELIHMLTGIPREIKKLKERFISNRGLMTGIGVSRPCPSDKNWIYFPEHKFPFYRVTYLSNYSPFNTPDENHFSLLCEISSSETKKVDESTILEKTIDGLVEASFLESADRARISSTWTEVLPYSLPVPFLGRNKTIGLVQDFLEKNDIYSRGRFGAWKYEIGNMDHSVVQGMELIDRLLFGEKESIFSSC